MIPSVKVSYLQKARDEAVKVPLPQKKNFTMTVTISSFDKERLERLQERITDLLFSSERAFFNLGSPEIEEDLVLDFKEIHSLKNYRGVKGLKIKNIPRRLYEGEFADALRQLPNRLERLDVGGNFLNESELKDICNSLNLVALRALKFCFCDFLDLVLNPLKNIAV